MADAFLQFDRRLRKIDRTHQGLSNGYNAVVGADGLITLKPKSRKRGLPIKGFVLFVIGFLCFKALMLAHLGPVSYNERVGKLASGVVVEQAGAWAMQADPATHWISTQIRPLLR